MTQRDAERLSSNSHPVHLANKIRGAHDLHQNHVLPRFLGLVVVLEDVYEVGGKVPTEANAFAHRTVVDPKLFLLRFK